MLDVPAATPVKQRCDSCGFLADVAWVLEDGDVATACWRHRIDLPPVPSTARRLERRYGRWYAGRISVAALLDSLVHLECERCTAAGTVVYELTTDDGHWQTVVCGGCVPPSRDTHSGARLHALAARADDATPWRSVADDWWPRVRQPRRP